MSKSEILYQCPKAGKCVETFKTGCIHKLPHEYAMCIGSVKCPPCLPVSESSIPEEPKPDNEINRLQEKCKTCYWQAPVCCSYESDCDGENHYEPKPDKGVDEIIYKGKIVLEKVGIACIHRPNGWCNNINPQIVGVLRTETGATSVACIENTLWHLNGKDVKVIIEVKK